MKIHEYQAKEIFRRFGVPTPRGEMVTTPDQARAVAERLGTKIVVVKAQIHAGGRGKAGGVKLAKSPADAANLAKSMMGMKLVTPQTGPAGRIVQRLLVEEGLDIKRELYLSILVDRAVAAPVIMASTAGGMEIEEVAHKNPELILRETILPATGLQPYHTRKLAFGLGLSGDTACADHSTAWRLRNELGLAPAKGNDRITLNNATGHPHCPNDAGTQGANP